ncbi:MAG TPA: exodeoxyribonuclease VII large subunit [Mariprofundaceae bacterium]|nr:exodeoxyribonuclease VII large subunit [Mariprofundaceae bacterium]
MSDAPLSVTELTARIKSRLEQDFSQVRLCGEVSRLTRPSSGHLYFTIKDQHAAIAAVVWRSTAVRLNTQPEETGEYIFSGHISVYEPRGTYQMIVTRVEAAGAGQLAAEFERRKQRFAERGWFDPASKKMPPAIPGHIGIATSSTAAAFEDVKKVLATRPGWLRLTHAPCLVQGTQAAASIADSIRRLCRMDAKPDVILLVRGGGSIEDLWCFNDELVVQAIVESPIPVITGIGHEIDITLADFAADVRAATPSNAVELACPASEELRERLPRMQTLSGLMLQHLMRHRRDLGLIRQRQQHNWERQSDTRHHTCEQNLALLQHHTRNSVQTSRQHLRQLEKRLSLQEPGQILRTQRRQIATCTTTLQTLAYRMPQTHRRQFYPIQEKLSSEMAGVIVRQEHALLHTSQHLHRLQGDVVGKRRHASVITGRELVTTAERRLEQRRQQHALLGKQLHALGPLHVLKRGYSLSYTADGTLVTRAAQLQDGDAMRVRFHDGEADTRIESVSVTDS